MIESPGRVRRWWGFWITMLLAFAGIQLMVNNSHSWFWFVPMLLPFIAVLQMESEKSDPIGDKDATLSGSKKKMNRNLGFWSAWIVAFISMVGMVESSYSWFWYAPLLIPFFILLPGKMRQWELEDEKKKREEADYMQRHGPKRAGKFLKILALLAVICVVWYIGGYFIWAVILG